MLVDEIKTRMLAALKGGRSLEKQILSVALGEIQTQQARKGDVAEPLADADAQACVRKIIKSNRETLEASPSAEQRSVLEQEIAVLETLLPKGLGENELRAALGPVEAAIRSAPADGQATGIAMKALKASGVVADGKLVGEVVKKMRA